MSHRSLAPLAVALFCLVGPSHSQDSQLRFDRLSSSGIEAHTDSILASAGRSLERILAAQGPRTVGNTLRPYDDYRIEVNRARVVSFIANVHPDSAIRAAAVRAEQRLNDFNRLRRGDRRVYEMFLAVDTVGADAEAKHWLRGALAAFREESIDRDEATRARAAHLERELTRLQRRWNENPRYDTITVAFDSAALVGLSPAWFAARPRGPRGEILVTGDELRNVVNRADSGAIRERALVLALRPRRNSALLDTILQTRHALATLLGDRSWAERQLRHTMAGSPERVRVFLDDVRRRSEPLLRRTFERASSGRAAAGAGSEATESIALHDYLYRSPEMAGSEGGAGPALRPYLPYSLVRDGLLELVRELVGIEFRPAPDLPIWHPTVEPYRVYEGDSLIARVYLDVHWRPGRSAQNASAANFRLGVRGKVITEAAIIGGLVRARPGDTALIGPRPMETLFHEFGHLLHYVLSVRPWFATSGLPDEFDFREVPSVLFEAWARDPAVVGRFARHYRTGEVPPSALLERLRVTERSGGLTAQVMSRISLELHDRPPGEREAIVRQAYGQAVPRGLRVEIRLPKESIHPEVSLPHIGGGYAAAYYTYLWSSVIAKDLLTKFDKGLLDPVAVRAYRTHILEPGRSRPARELIESFLGRPFTLDAWARSLAVP